MKTKPVLFNLLNFFTSILGNTFTHIMILKFTGPTYNNQDNYEDILRYH